MLLITIIVRWCECSIKPNRTYILLGFLVLAVWGLGGCGDWRPAACQRWEAAFRPLSWGSRVLERPGGEGICKVRRLQLYTFTDRLQTKDLFGCVMSLLSWMWQVERLLRGSFRRLHVWGIWGLHRWSDRDVWAEKSSTQPLQHNQKSCGERLPDGLLNRC